MVAFKAGKRPLSRMHSQRLGSDETLPVPVLFVTRFCTALECVRECPRHFASGYLLSSFRG